MWFLNEQFWKGLIFLLPFLGMAAPGFALAASPDSIRGRLADDIHALAQAQAPSGAFHQIQCLDKRMTHFCRTDESLFMTALVADALAGARDNAEAERIRRKAVAYLKAQQAGYGGLVKYFPYQVKRGRILKHDVDDNALVLGVLTGEQVPLPDSLLDQMVEDGIRGVKVQRKGTSEVFQGRVFTTWLKPSKPLFSDLDVVVNANALWLFGLRGIQGSDSRLGDVCGYVNTVADWGSQSPEWSAIYSDRPWQIIKKANYSAWYPSPYTFAYNLVRAATDGRQRCLAPALEKAEALLASSEDYGKLTGSESYDRFLGAAALGRVLEFKKNRGTLGADQLEHASRVLDRMIEPLPDSRHDFYYYGSTGYVGSEDLRHAFAIEAAARFLRASATPEATSALEISSDDSTGARKPADGLKARLQSGLALGLQNFRKEQQSDGSWTRLIVPSSIMYNTHMIFLYEYLGLMDRKADRVSKLMSHIWSRQKPGGGFAGYAGGADHMSVSVLAYLAAKISGEDERSERMLKLEKVINSGGGLSKAGFLATPYLMIFGLDPRVNCLPEVGMSLAMRADGELPWVRVMLYPLQYMFSSGKIHRLDGAKSPSRLKPMHSVCGNWIPHPLRGLHIGEKGFVKWTLAHLNDDGTLFDYTPTTIPTLMALGSMTASRPELAALVDKGVATLETFQQDTGAGLMQTPGEASIAETYAVMNAFLESGVPASDRALLEGERFLLEHRQARGSFGFSKHNSHFPDSDDTGSAIFVLERMASLHGDTAGRQDLERGLDWLLKLQNSDGGFATWEKNRLPLVNRLKDKLGLGIVLSESVIEHTARITLALDLYRRENMKYQQAYDRAIGFLLSRQQADGSFVGTWFVDYLFGTSMVLNALSTEGGSRTRSAIERGLSFLFSHQQADGGFGESPQSFLTERAVMLDSSSPAQTGLIVSQLLSMKRDWRAAGTPEQKAALRAAVDFLSRTQKSDGLWHDPTWTAVTFPKVEYLIYPYVQEIAPLQAMGMYLQKL